MRKIVVVALLGCAMALPVQAGRIEDAFRDFIDRLRQAGQRIEETRRSLSFQEVQVPELAPRVEKLPLGRQSYALFVTPGCRGCAEAERFLKGKGLDVEVLDVGRSATAREAYSLTGGTGYPVLLVGSQRLTGWNERLFKDAVRLELQESMRSVQGQGA